MVTAAQATGEIAWDLPESLQYAPNADIKTEIEVRNPSGSDQLYGVVSFFARTDGYIQKEELLTFSNSHSFGFFYLGPNRVFPFSLTFRTGEADVIFGMRLHQGIPLNGTAKLGAEIARIQTLLASEASYNQMQMGSMMGMMLPMMMIGMVMPMVKDAFAPPPPEYPALPPGRGE